MAGLARQLMEAPDRGLKAQAVLKLFTLLAQAKWVTQLGLSPEWSAAFMGLMQVCLAALGSFTVPTT